MSLRSLGDVLGQTPRSRMFVLQHPLGFSCTGEKPVSWMTCEDTNTEMGLTASDLEVAWRLFIFDARGIDADWCFSFYNKCLCSRRLSSLDGIIAQLISDQNSLTMPHIKVQEAQLHLYLTAWFLFVSVRIQRHENWTEGLPADVCRWRKSELTFDLRLMCWPKCVQWNLKF